MYVCASPVGAGDAGGAGGAGGTGGAGDVCRRQLLIFFGENCKNQKEKFGREKKKKSVK